MVHKADILIVDDTLENLRLLSQILSGHGYLVRVALNGLHALDTISEKAPDLILLDIMMPHLDGYEVCARLKADERTRSIPIIFISALDGIDDKIRAFEVGGVDYITKPFQIEEVLVRVQTHLALRNLQYDLQIKISELDSFAHTVAHDLKNPLTTIIGYASLMSSAAGKDLPVDRLRQIVTHDSQLILQIADQMNNIIDSLLVLASVQNQAVIFHPVNMGPILEKVQQRILPQIHDNQARLILPDQWPMVQGYAPWVEEIWANYLSNALKYGGQPPQIELGATPQNDGWIRFWVRDHGPGLTQEQQSRLFTPFERLGQPAHNGHGLGLSIVSRIVERLGGQVGVESAPGQGTTFFFTLLESRTAS